MSKKIISLMMAVALVVSAMATAINAFAIIQKDVTYGDVDGNNAVNTEDARLALLSAAGIKTITDEAAFERADVNSDGAVSLYDARQILRGAAGIVRLQPSGAFYGFTGYKDDTINISSPEAAIAVFNTCLNKIKTEKPGFVRSEAADVVNFNIEEVTLVGIDFGNSAESVTDMIEDLLVSETEPEEAQTIIKGTNCDNAMSVEKETYVSKLSANDIYGVTVEYDGEGTMTITVALADCEIDNISQSAYADVFNTELLVKDSKNVLESVFTSNELSDAARKDAKNAVLTMSFDTATGNVISYTTTYETDMYILQSTMGVSSILSAELKGIQYGTKNTVTYDNFQW
ncbi:MAG: hypothetical protein J6D06_09955 [Clostridia bacterium]|nr:hypothetical protein [Clostridia bacterium]